MPVRVHAEHIIENTWDTETGTGLGIVWPGSSSKGMAVQVAGKAGLDALRQVISDLQKLEDEFKQFIPNQSD